MQQMNLDKAISGFKSIGIAGHMHPDGDCVGSCLGLYNYIRDYFPETKVSVFLEDAPEIFSYMRYFDMLQTPESYQGEAFELFISLDCSDKSRLDGSVRLFDEAGSTICIDHHISNRKFAKDNYVIDDVSSTSEMVADLIGAERMNPDIASCLYTGIVHDTGVFQHSCTSPHTMEVAGMLLGHGVDQASIIEQTFFQKTFVQNRLLGVALTKARLFDEGRIVATILDKSDFESVGAAKSDTEGIVDQLRVTKGTEVAVFMYQNTDRVYKVSLRCKGDYNMADIALGFGGGGHAKAAGFFAGTDGEKALADIIEKIKEQLYHHE